MIRKSIGKEKGSVGTFSRGGGGDASDNSSIRAVQFRDFGLDRISDLERVWLEVFGKFVLEAIQRIPSYKDIDHVDIEMIAWSQSLGL